MGNITNSTLSRNKPLKRGSGFKKRGTKLKRARQDTVGKLKKKLWALCRQIVIKQYGNTCYSCYAPELVGSNLHLGHFIPSSVCSAELRYALENLRPQCFRCNIHLSGNWPAYEAHLKQEGVNVEALKARNEATKGMQADRLWYQAKIEEYQKLV